MKKYRSFTLVEILVVIGIVTIIGVLVIPISLNRLVFERLDSSANIIASSIFKQQQNALSKYMNSEFGVVINSNSIELYRGNSYATATYISPIAFDNVIISTNIPGSLIHFSNSLLPSQSGSIYIQSESESIEVVLNKYGLVYVNK